VVQEGKGIVYIRASEDTTSHRGCDGLYRITLLRVDLKKTVDRFLLKECRKRPGRLSTTVHFKRDPRFSLSIKDVEQMLCRWTRNVNLWHGAAGIRRKLGVRRWYRTMSGVSPVTRRG